jgi:hypothetical protein
MEMVHGALFMLLIFSALMTPGSSQESCGPGRVYNTVLRRCVNNAGEFSRYKNHGEPKNTYIFGTVLSKLSNEVRIFSGCKKY